MALIPFAACPILNLSGVLRTYKSIEVAALRWETAFDAVQLVAAGPN